MNRNYKDSTYKYIIKTYGPRREHLVLTTELIFKNPNQIDKLEELLFFDNKEIAQEATKYLKQKDQLEFAWPVTASTSNLDNMKLINVPFHVEEYLDLRNAENYYENAIYNKYSSLLSIDRIGRATSKQRFKDYIQRHGYQRVVMFSFEYFKNWYEKQYVRSITNPYKEKLEEVIFMNSRGRTILKFRDMNNVIKIIKVEIKDINDRNFSNELGFLFAFYKYKHEHFDSTGLKNKLNMVLKGLNKTRTKEYLRSYFLESRTMRLEKALKLLKAISEFDLELGDRTLKLKEI